MRNKPEENDAWQAVSERDGAYDAVFVFAVKTTGIFCKPSCPARRPLRRNVVFYAGYDEATANGYRPCKRCKPDPRMGYDARADVIADACRRIENAIENAEGENVSLADLAGPAGLSPHHFQKVFKAVAGVSPKEYAVATRSDKIRRRLNHAPSITEAIYDAGYTSAGRFYEQAGKILGMTPSEYKNGGAELDIKFALGECSLGTILVASSTKGICGISLGDDPEDLLRDLEDRFRNATLIGGDADFEDTVARVVGLIENPRASADLPLDIRGTAFQHKVWKALCDIPVGQTKSYRDIAETIGAPAAARAVAAACAANRLAIAIPCHRVVRRDGGLSGYRWGIDRKRKLLAREAKA
ncbi:MAG: bifunctional DNA-binding transcriptional regulator/O6-methylguanine-DNA methyltransferase Ada [Rhodospirillales bacterium]